MEFIVYFKFWYNQNPLYLTFSNGKLYKG